LDIHQVTFRNETGFGSGVTAGFYSRIAEILQTRAFGFGMTMVGVAPTAAKDGELNFVEVSCALGQFRILHFQII
jgi:hypothetical protein